MWVERIVGNVADGVSVEPGAQPTVQAPVGVPATFDHLDLRWDQCRRVLKSTTRAGTPIRVVLPPGTQLRHGDVLASEDDARRVVVNVLPCEVIVARPAAGRDAALLCLELGNLHWPVQVNDGEVIFIEDGPQLAVLESMGIAFQRETRRFEPAAIQSMPGVQVRSGMEVIGRSE